MTRFIMTIEESAELVLRSLTIARGGEVFVTKMPVVMIPDLAAVIIELLAPRFGFLASDIVVEEIGAKPGEKLYEELMSEEEVHRSLELKDMFVITPAFKSIYQDISYEYADTVARRLERSYVSVNETPLSKEQVKEYLLKHQVLEQILGDM
jgi:FlaA1/EpsC-like NDP-sugar epimerase